MLEFGESVHFKPVGEHNAMRGGDQRMLRGVYVGHHERSGPAIFFTPDGVKRRTRIVRMLGVFGDGIECSVQHACIGVPWQLRPVQRKLARFLVLVAEADHGVSLVIVMSAVARVDQRRYVTKRHLVKYGHTDDCQGCTQLAAGMHHAKVLSSR